MDKASKENLVNDIENRLDDFFSDGDTAPSAEKPKASLEKLKSLVLSIDWEITEACLTDLIAETDSLSSQYQDDRITHALFRMLRAVSRYIRKHKAQAHPDAIKRIMSVFASLELLIQDQQLAEDLKKRIVAKEIAAFKKLKQQVEVKRGTIEKTVTDDSETAPGFMDQHKFEQAMNAVEERLNSQVAALKTQLATLQNELDSLRNT